MKRCGIITNGCGGEPQNGYLSKVLDREEDREEMYARGRLDLPCALTRGG